MKNSHSSKDDNIEVTIKTTEGDWKTSFAKTAKVSEVIKAVAEHFGFEGGKFELFLENDQDEALNPNRPIVSYGIKDGDELFFTDLGIAV